MNTQYETANARSGDRRAVRIPVVARKISAAVARLVREVYTANELLWEHHQRVDPRRTAVLHWEPTLSGWRLYGRYAPSDEPCRR